MKKTVTPLLLLLCAPLLILDSQCAAASVRDGLELCTKTLIPGLFPLLVLSAMAVPHLRAVRIPFISGLLRLPEGSEGLYLLGAIGGFPVGAVCICQMVRAGALSRSDAQRMLGLCSNCGVSFLFGVIAAVLSPKAAVLIFLFQLLSSLFLGILWPGESGNASTVELTPLSLNTAVRQSLSSMANICGWVILAAVLTGFLRKWLFPLFTGPICALLTGLLELTGGIFALPGFSEPVQLILATGIVCFGGISVLLQIQSCAASAGVSMKTCILQKASQAILGAGLCTLYLRFGISGIWIPAAAVLGKKAVEISGTLMYNTQRKEGI